MPLCADTAREVPDTIALSGTRQSPRGGGGELPPEGAGRERVQPQRALPAAFDGTRVDAKYVDEILTLTLPKPETARPRRVRVQTS
jgi:HSP20 family molecular chaperone IbpA